MGSLRYYGDPMLRRHTTPVKRFDRELRELADEMLDTMYEARGVGLAAPQVGVSRQLIVLDVSEDRDDPQIMVNPRILRRKGEKVDTEGCLSIPGLQVEIPRSVEIEVRYADLEGREHTLKGKDLWARVVQHEMDHLEGRLIVDFMEPEKRQAFEADWPALKEAKESST